MPALYSLEPSTPSQIVLLPAGPRILVHMPLCVPTPTLKGTAPNLEEPHCHPRANLCQLHALIPCPHKHMMPHFDAVIDILERHDSVADFLICSCCFSWGKEVFQYLHDTFSE